MAISILCGRLPLAWQQFGQAVVRMGGDAREHVAKIGEGFNVMALAGCNQANTTAQLKLKISGS